MKNGNGVEFVYIKGLNNQIKTFLFDLDGTLIDSMPIWNKINIDFLQKRGLDCPRDLQEQLEGMSDLEMAHYFRSNLAVSDPVNDIIKEWEHMYDEYFSSHVTLQPGSRELLDTIINSGCNIGLGTNSGKKPVFLALSHLRLLNYFQSIVTGTDVSHVKPSPDIYQKLADNLMVDASNCIVVEDSLTGVVAGKRAGMTVFLINSTNEPNKVSEYQLELPDMTFRSIHDLSVFISS